jgi:hypothetical protein
MDPETEKAIRRLERHHVGAPGCLFKGALLYGLILAALAVGLWLIGYISRHREVLFK